MGPRRVQATKQRLSWAIRGRRARARLRRQVRAAPFWLLLLAMIGAPFALLLILVDLLVDQGDGQKRWLHLLAQPFEVLVLLTFVIAAFATMAIITVRGGISLLNLLLLAVLGRSMKGTVSQHLRTVHGRDADGDPTAMHHVEVEFVDGAGRPQLVEYSSRSEPAVGTAMRIRSQIGRPSNRWVRRAGLGPLVGGVFGYVLGLVVWIFCASPFIFGAYWLLGHAV